jgi:hypothetical protein
MLFTCSGEWELELESEEEIAVEIEKNLYARSQLVKGALNLRYRPLEMQPTDKMLLLIASHSERDDFPPSKTSHQRPPPPIKDFPHQRPPPNQRAPPQSITLDLGWSNLWQDERRASRNFLKAGKTL